MTALPLYVRIGWVIAKLVVVIPAITAVGATWLRRRSRDRREARKLVAARAANVTAPVEGHATVRGVYRAKGDDHWIEHDGERIDLASAPDVLRGSRATWTWRMPAPVHAIADGDEVIAEGRLERTADATADAAASYRRPAGAWVMSAPVVHATAPAICPRPLGLAALWIACAVGVASYTAGRVIGDVRWERPETDELRADDVIAAHPRLAIAAALPGHRDRALDELEEMVERSQVNGADTDTEIVDLARISGGCDGAARALLRQERYEAAAAGCSPAVTVEALLFLGRYTEANALATPDNASLFDRQLAAIGAGDWRKAAVIADELAESFRTGKILVVTDREAAAVNLDCFADLMRTRAGVTTATAHLRQLATRSPSCGVIDALARPMADQPAAFAALSLGGADPIRFEAEDLAWAAGAVQPRETDLFQPISAALDAESFSTSGWLAPFALAARDAPLARAWMAERAFVIGESPAPHLAALRAAIPHGIHGYDDVEALALAEALRTGQPLPIVSDPIHPALADFVALRKGDVPRSTGLDWLPAFEREACDPLVAKALDAARGGDGTLLASVLAHCTLHWLRGPTTVLALLPRITRGRAELATAMRTFRDMFGSTTLAVPFSFATAAAMHRDLARAAGDPDDAARWQQIVSAHAAALADRDRVTAMILWHML